MLSARFRCFAECPGTYPVDQVIYRCSSCGGLLEVAHDMEALRGTTADGWKATFADRWRSMALPDGSGVWGKREWVLPGVRAENIVSLNEGASPLQDMPAYAEATGVGRVLIKQCGITHTGSFKDLGMTVLVSMVKQMIADGKPVRAVACASTGDTSAALAAYAARAGIRAIVILPRGKVSTAQLVQPLANGATVMALDTDFDGCMAHVQTLAEKEGVYLANSMNSLRVEGQKTVSIELAQQLGWSVPDWVVIPGGNLGNVSALEAGFRMMMELGLTTRMPRICVAQAAHASPLYDSFVRGFEDFQPVVARGTAASAIRIGNPISRNKAIRALQSTGGIVERATEAELADASARADRFGQFTCPHTGVALAALEKLAARREITADHTVVVVSTANGLKFSGFKTQYHDGTLAEVSSPKGANLPVLLPDSYDALRDAVVRVLDA